MRMGPPDRFRRAMRRKLFSRIRNARNDADCVFAIRKSRGDGFLRMVTSKLCWLGTLLWTGADLRDPNVPYRLIRAEVLRKALPRVPSDFFVQNVALTLALKRERRPSLEIFPHPFPKPGRRGELNQCQKGCPSWTSDAD